MDAFNLPGRPKFTMSTERTDTLDLALLRTGRLDRKIEVPLPNEPTKPVNKRGDIDFEAIVKPCPESPLYNTAQLTDRFNVPICATL